MKRLLKSVVLAVVLTFMLSSSSLASDATQQIEYLRSLKIVAPEGSQLTIDARILNLIVELNIHKMGVESEETFQGMVKETTFPDDARLTMRAGWFQNIASQVLSGEMNDDTALYLLQIPETMETSIDGTFTGWSGDTTFNFKNGQVWKQSSLGYTYHYAYSPKITIYKFWYSPAYKMQVEGVDETIDVIRVE